MAYLVRTPSSAGNRKTFTLSAWIKPNVPSSGSTSMFSAWSADNVAGHFVWRIKTDGTIGWSRWSDDSYSTRKLRDVHAWYHCVIAVDTTQATASDRVKLYVNNEQITSFSVGATYPAQNTDLPVNNTNSQTIGLNNYSSSGNPYAGYMSHFHLVDGTALTPSAFGSTDATTGEWKINTSPSVTYGTNGFFMFKDDNSANDDSGQSNNFTLSGTLPKSEDCPDNVFATWNPLDNLSNHPASFSNGNTTVSIPNSGGKFTSTLAVNSGKYYCEVKLNTMASGVIGIQPIENSPSVSFFDSGSNGIGLYSTGGTIYNNGSNIGSIASISNNDIIGIALDLDNNNVYFSKNGQYASGLSGSWNQTFSNAYARPITSGYSYCVSGQNGGSGTSSNFSINYGNGYFGTTAVSSAGTNASGIGIFEYDVPTGYTALSTKGLNL